MKKQLANNQRKQHKLEKEIDDIIWKMTQEGIADLKDNRVRKRGKLHHYRIVTEDHKPTHTSKKRSLPAVPDNAFETQNFQTKAKIIP